jgi:hypothetical protein
VEPEPQELLLSGTGTERHSSSGSDIKWNDRSRRSKKIKKLHDNNAASNTKRKDFVQHFI